MKLNISTFDSYYSYIGKHFFFPMSLACALGICLIYGGAHCDSAWLVILGLLLGVPFWLWSLPLILMILAISPLAFFKLAYDLLVPYEKQQSAGESDVTSSPDRQG